MLCESTEIPHVLNSFHITLTEGLIEQLMKGNAYFAL